MLIPAAAIIAAAFSAALYPAALQQGTPANSTEKLTATAVRAQQAPDIDGSDSDPVWQLAPRYSQFRQFEPKVDADPSFKTEFRAAYDDRNLYVFVRMFDPHPDSIMRALSRRDQRGPSDQIKLLIDSYNDQRTGFEFAVNPDGVKRDYTMSNDGDEDGSWNGIWDVATKVDADGWTAEFRIPLSQLRYAKAARNTFGFGVWRDIERYRERSGWPLWNPSKTGLSSQLGRLEGLEGLSAERRMEATPYAVTKNVRKTLPSSPFNREQEMSVGGDLKIGITPNVTLDATVNPDFGQVEADPSVVNLTAFETFFSERRPFFVEGSNQYRFALNCYIVVDCSTNEGLFYSRRIGRSPSLRGVYGDATTPAATTIAAATKLTGRTKSGLSFGILDALTPEVRGTPAGAGLERRTVEPMTNFAVMSAQQDLRGGDAGLSLIGTAVNRVLDQWTENFMHRDAYAGGATFRNRFGGRKYEVAGQLAMSHVTGTKPSILRTQQNSVHYYQQPGDELAVDRAATSLSGYAAQLKVGKYSGGITRFESSLVRQSPGFDVNDLGFLRRADVTDWSTWAALSWRQATKWYRWAQVNGNHWESWNTSGTRLQNAVNFNGHVGLPINWDLHLGGTVDRLSASYCDRCTRGGPVLRGSRGFYPWGGFNTDSRKRISGGLWFNAQFYDERRSKGVGFDPYLNFRLSPQFQLNVGFGGSRNRNNTQWFDNFVDAVGVTHHTFAHLDQHTRYASVRMNYTATRDLTLEMYAQPFVATGVYTNLRELSADPRAADYDARFQPYTGLTLDSSNDNFKVTELITNSVVRWEYRPGSTLFVVWQHGRSGPDPDQPFRQAWHRDYRELFDLHPENTFLVKVAYWLNR
jgi:hypothetical protein